MKAVITGGGTGGHIYPALAVAEELQKRGWEILYLGSDHRMEAEIVPGAGFEFKAFSVRPLPRKMSTKIFSSLYFNTRAFFKALKIIKDFKADFVIGTGGFVAGPVVLAGSLLRKKTIIHEQNAYPGITNKLLARVVDKICLNFSEAADYLKVEEDKIEITGNPVRPRILKVNRDKAYKELKLNPELKTILITGGSLGAEIINQNIIALYKYAVQNKIQILHLSGKKNYSQLLAKLKNNNLEPENSLLKIIDYLDEMEYALAAADLIIARAGATGLAEITSCAKPSILIPFAAAAENHQLVNAQTLQENNAALVIEESELNDKLLLDKVKTIIEDTEKLKSMSAAAESMSQKDSLANIIKVIEKLI
ncbi:UDP-N-acetylglucosamine-N-acetylmuramylpentapeptide N-acetylglucosamine transferase [Halanaerobium saccharolyticum]|uniref:UDP-N-acetylglucosamine--N-acetylmuramyl-(pentapeptide) pyrophosphoryl-undecaprenol N-acetylglucosamine transferase n=1 Tax=Halanaerobium saccharolyticum TaxID=43595 RepID=A0A4R7Z3R0_9FIRM|nr:undecaprenyldiphospho-muramoylpentapeptide beta-N-acetylglucosaminyltransferase [Halanaerobium saccharolyticum]RAK07406.1 UDP-N-acetylglucosamine-N-acetylmuramylpentapeptide N-acetylglucosamine transferase [Halanaerobium saccharolyticum]TDW02371.1 UDP-N-acetylglucosamine-N-acetylmuramylpentapeptide N-acetylglucosamine transferase [Halanaerobium saccharolyticum]TDX59091.1 UDP-N-acetylglucosamine-N-acetylmuramylpentapeptide N-acetylglucosamine transferase [Halanaerobium saccharolyticum]